MNLLWPGALFLLGLIPLLVAVYLLLLRRRRRFAVRYSSLSLVREALPAQSRLRRYLPPALFLLALASLVLALARPVTVTSIPAGQATVILALDVSGSMRQTDIWPSRLGAAKEAALSFIDRQHASNQIGIVAFAGIAQLVQPPTSNARDLQTAVNGLTMGRGTAIGSGILVGLDTIAELNDNVAPSAIFDHQAPPNGFDGDVFDIIVLLTDGVYTTGPDPLFAAQQAGDRGVRVYTIGFGTETGSPRQGDQFGGRFRRGIDEDSLREIAAMTGGEYFYATSADELQRVFESLPTYLVTREVTTEISVVFAALGALLVLAAIVLSQLWHPLL
jgi:Ca-activated chloride channel homolog